MKRYFIGAIVGILLTLLGGHFYTKWRMGDLKKKNAALKEEISVMTTSLANYNLGSDKKIEALLKQIGGLQGNVDSLMFANANLEADLASQTHETEAAEANAAALQTEIQPVLDANPKVREAFEAKDRVIISLKAENFSLREQRQNDQKIIFSLTEKYEAQVQISKEYLGKLKETRGLLAKVELRLNLQDKRVAFLETLSKWKTAGLVLVGAAGLALAIF